MKKRLRKKLHVGEFQELGFSVCFRLKDGLSEDEMGAFIKNFLKDAIESKNLCFAGSGNQVEWDGLVMKNSTGSVDEEQRKSICSWLEKNEKIESVETSDLIDVWYE